MDPRQQYQHITIGPPHTEQRHAIRVSAPTIATTSDTETTIREDRVDVGDSASSGQPELVQRDADLPGAAASNPTSTKVYIDTPGGKIPVYGETPLVDTDCDAFIDQWREARGLRGDAIKNWRRKYSNDHKAIRAVAGRILEGCTRSGALPWMLGTVEVLNILYIYYGAGSTKTNSQAAAAFYELAFGSTPS